jgi:hypothetical protein
MNERLNKFEWNLKIKFISQLLQNKDQRLVTDYIKTVNF